MNREAKIDGFSESRVAADFVQSHFGLQPVVEDATPWQNFIARLKEHLFLVAVSLFAGIAVALPLGVFATRYERLGQIVLAATGVLQTIPSLALLVFMIPWLGIGPLPAIVALFLYSLLPMVRNTYSGLKDISPSLHESAAALGLPSIARLRLIELPLASRSILAGIKTSAVVTIGTATLGALIGAGGFGQPILIGIRRNDFGMILQGAVPAALLAICVQFLFEWAERRIVPRGLRLKAQVMG
jgi:osmoprotectant transport system permease protein